MRFLVLRMPGRISHYDINRRATTKDIDVGESHIKGGHVRW